MQKKKEKSVEKKCAVTKGDKDEPDNHGQADRIPVRAVKTTGKDNLGGQVDHTNVEANDYVGAQPACMVGAVGQSEIEHGQGTGPDPDPQTKDVLIVKQAINNIEGKYNKLCNDRQHHERFPQVALTVLQVFLVAVVLVKLLEKLFNSKGQVHARIFRGKDTQFRS